MLVDIYSQAKKLHIQTEAMRVVYLIETRDEKDVMALEAVRSVFAPKSQDIITAVDQKNIVVVKSVGEEDTYDTLDEIAVMLAGMLNTDEDSSRIRVAYGTMVSQIRDLSKSYKEAKMALEVGKIFYPEATVNAYHTLGIGRLIYQLPQPLCEMFMQEVFHENTPDTFDEETLSTIEKFFENNLNVSETARQLFVHRNTLVYRLEKLQKTTGLDIRVFEDAPDLQNRPDGRQLHEVPGTRTALSHSSNSMRIRYAFNTHSICTLHVLDVQKNGSTAVQKLS